MGEGSTVGEKNVKRIVVMDDEIMMTKTTTTKTNE